MTWEPTNELRFVTRHATIETLKDGATLGRAVHILQQKWVAYEMFHSTAGRAHPAHGTKQYTDQFEWRDVPTETEE